MAVQGTSTATILFTDIVESTALRARLGEEAADRLFVEHQRQLGQVVTRHGGRVLKAGGDGVMATFGSASEAVQAAVALQEQVCRATPQLAIRVGVAAGDVAWEDGDCFGLPVVTAARLQATAEGGEILVSHTVRLLAGDRAGDRYAHVGGLDLKGLPEPVDAYTVGWQRPDGLGESDAAGPPPLPLPLTITPTHPLVGRADAVAALRQAWSEARIGPGRAVLIGGEAGAGKTRLAAEFAAELHGSGTCVLYGGCDFDLALPFQPWVHAADHLLATLPRGALSADLTAALAPLASLLSRAEWLTAEARRISLDAEAERYRTYSAFSAMFGEACRRWPTLVVLDDLHWAGSQTLALLRHLARAGLATGLLVVGAFRDTGDEVTEPLAGLLAGMRRVEGVTRLRLAGLDTPAVERFVADAVHQPLDADLRALAGRLADRSGGNAFYLGELWRHLLDTGTVARQGPHWTVREDEAPAQLVPDSVREVVTDRLAHLSPAARRIAELASLSGHRIDLQVLEAAGDRSPEDLDRAVDELVGAGLLFAVPGSALVYRFAHALVRDTVEASISPHVKGRHHLALAEAIESVHGADRRPVLAELAGHFALAGRPLDKIAYYGRRAAAQAMRAAAYDEAVGHLRIVLEQTPPSIERSAALVDLAKAQIRRGVFDESRDGCIEAFRIATELGHAVAAADAAIGFENSMHVPGYPGGPGVDMLRAALTMLGDDEPAKRAEVMASLGRALVFSGRGAEGNDTSEAAVTLARQVGDPAILAVALQALVSSSEDPNREVELGIELAEIADRIGDPWSASYATANLMRAYVTLGRIDEAIEVQARHRATSAAGHFATFEFMTHAYDAVLALAAADFTAAEAAAERAQAKGAADDAPYDEGVYGLQMYAIRRAQGRLAEVEPVMRVLARTDEAAPTWRPGLAALYTDLGMLDEARGVFESLATDDFAGVMRDAVWPASLTFLAETCLALGDRRRAAVLVDELEPHRGRNLMAGMTICFGPADRLLGGLSMLLGRPDDADRHFAAALALAEAFRSPLWTVEVQYDWANALVDRDPERAEALARQAITSARLLGIGRIAGRPIPGPSSSPIVDTGASSDAGGDEDDDGDVVPAVVPLPDHLSAREAEVLRLVASGRSNREIGEHLFISQNTVANHVRAILRKSGCANRTEATRYAVRHDLLDE